MCEITNGKIFVADRDISCYKIIRKRPELCWENGHPKEWKSVMVPANHNGMYYEIGKEYRINNFRQECFEKNNEDSVVTAWLLSETGDRLWTKRSMSLRNFRYIATQIVMHNMSSVVMSTYSAYTPVYNENYIATKSGFYAYTHYMNGKMSKDLEWHVRMKTDETRNYVAVKCTIPKGSHYLVSDSAECFVSEKIILDRIVEII